MIRTRVTAAAVAGALALLAAGQSPVWAGPAGAAKASSSPALAGQTFGSTPAGGSGPDDITILDGTVFVGFQNGIGPDGSPGTPTGPTQSTVAGFDQRTGQLVASIKVMGKVDGLRGDAAHDRLIATVNEDLHSALYVIDPWQGVATRYTYSPDPATPISPVPASGPTTAGGTDSISIIDGHIYLAHSFPAGAVNFPSATDTFADPTAYEVTLDHGSRVAELRPLWRNDSRAKDAVTGQRLQLQLSDPDSNTPIPDASPRFAGQLEQMSQGDGQMIFAAGLPGRPRLTQLTLSDNVAGNHPPVDDIAVTTSGRGTLYVVDAGAGTVLTFDTTGWHAGTVFVAEPNDNGNPLLGTLDLWTGVITPLVALKSPKGLLFVPAADRDGR
jgi:hypothetical protein